MIRKTILEKVRARAGMGGYVLTSLKDNPLSTSALFDDAMRPKYDARAFKQFNADSVILLGQGRAREWRNGGDRPRRFDVFNHVGGTPVRFSVLLAHVGAPLAGGQLRCHLVDADGSTRVLSAQTLRGPLPHGDPGIVGIIEFVPPARDHAYRLRLKVELVSSGATIRNEWPLWIYPAITEWPEAGIFDPAGCLAGLDDLYHAAQPVEPDDISRWPQTVIASAVSTTLLDHLRSGGKVVLIQTADLPLPVVAVPFWREAIKLIADHPVMNAFPHDHYAHMQFYHLAGDRALDTARLAEVIPDISAVQSLLGRLDARLFTWADYLVEARVGAGTLIATTLRFMGGAGDQVSGLRDNIAGRFLLNALLA